MVTLISQSRNLMLKLNAVIGIRIGGNKDPCYVYAKTISGREYTIGEFNTKTKAKKIMYDIWKAIELNESYSVPKEEEVNDDRTES